MTLVGERAGSLNTTRSFRVQDLESFLLPRTLKKITVDPVTGCWNYSGVPNRTGYGRIRYQNKLYMAHKLVYSLLVGPIPEGLLADHTCHDPKVCRLGIKCPHRRCLNPAHIEFVTTLVNSSPERSVTKSLDTHCAKGHEFTPENVRQYGNGGRRCKQCSNEYQRNHRAKKKLDPFV